MEILIKRLTSNKLGTHYGLFIEGLLIHYEFSRLSAEKVLDKINNGKVLYEIIYDEIKQFHVKKSFDEIGYLKEEIGKLKKEMLKIKSTKKTSILNKEIENNIFLTSNKQKNSFDLDNKEKEISCSEIEDLFNLKIENKIKNKKDNVFIKPNFEQKIPKKYGAINLAKKYHLSKIESEELLKLITDMRAMNFSSSGDLSNHIKKNKLGHKYPNISGILEMENEGGSWIFEGGFPRKIYRIVCTELHLHGKGTSARVVGFKPYKDL